MQDTKKVVNFCDIPLSMHSHTSATVASLGGNIHNEHVCLQRAVKLFKAVEVLNLKLCENGSYVAYKVEDDDEVANSISICQP